MTTAIKVCRVCLQMGVTLLKLHSSSLDQYYEFITEINADRTHKLPMYACNQCAWLIRKYYYFKQKCMRALFVLESIVQYKEEVTERDILKIDREAILLNTSLTLSKNVCDIDIDPTKNNIHNNEVKIKTFPDVPMNNLFFDMDTFDTRPDNDWPSDDDAREIKDDDSDDDLIALSELGVVKAEPKLSAKQKTSVKNSKRSLKKDKPLVSISKQHKIRIRKGKGFITPKDINLPKDIDLKFDDNFTVAETTKEEQIEEIKKRQDSERYRKAEFKCEMCYKCFSNDKLWQMHKERHDLSAGEAECEICKLRFSSTALKRHMYSVHSKKYLCKQCPFIASTFNRAKQHLLQHKGVTYKCPHCDEVTNNLNAILGHVRKRHASDILCRLCGLPFVSRMGLIRHKALMHKDRDEKTEIEENPNAPYCADCDMKFANVEAFKRHHLTARKHKDATKNTIGCRECGETFASKKARREHTSLFHKRTLVSKPPPAAWPDKCHLCSEVITSARSLWAHFRMNHPYEDYPRERPFICDVCGIRMRYKKGLEAHMYTHLKEKPFKCARCGKGFNSAGNLATHHGSVHSDLRPHVCTICNRAFKKKNTLRCHFMTHTGEKPYRCEICGHAFTQSNSCKSHIRKVHGEQPPKIISRNNYSN